jgi:hypothetical protein
MNRVPVPGSAGVLPASCCGAISGAVGEKEDCLQKFVCQTLFSRLITSANPIVIHAGGQDFTD